MDELEKPSQDGTLMAYLSYASCLFGLPLFLIPMLQRNDSFALYHAKNAAVAWVSLWVCAAAVGCGSVIFGMLTFGIGSLCCMPLMFLPWVPMIHGFLLVNAGKREAPFLTFGLGERIFAPLQVDGSR